MQRKKVKSLLKSQSKKNQIKRILYQKALRRKVLSLRKLCLKVHLMLRVFHTQNYSVKQTGMHFSSRWKKVLKELAKKFQSDHQEETQRALTLLDFISTNRSTLHVRRRKRNLTALIFTSSELKKLSNWHRLDLMRSKLTSKQEHSNTMLETEKTISLKLFVVKEPTQMKMDLKWKELCQIGFKRIRETTLHPCTTVSSLLSSIDTLLSTVWKHW